MQPRWRSSIELRSIQLDSEMVRLGVVHGDVGAAHRADGIAITLDELGDTDTRRDHDRKPVEQNRPTRSISTPSRELEGSIVVGVG